ncbi:unnamed protein product [Periconia digitata]|uniref:Uncharacterized protein n=1 Tax=Periconia digitata TaxID=1303443 RepID=A0A9W4XWI2_9PLEO|nr:unnamed protein product [Periconia digitata]
MDGHVSVLLSRQSLKMWFKYLRFLRMHIQFILSITRVLRELAVLLNRRQRNPKLTQAESMGAFLVRALDFVLKSATKPKSKRAIAQ